MRLPINSAVSQVVVTVKTTTPNTDEWIIQTNFSFDGLIKYSEQSSLKRTLGNGLYTPTPVFREKEKPSNSV